MPEPTKMWGGAEGISPELSELIMITERFFPNPDEIKIARMIRKGYSREAIASDLMEMPRTTVNDRYDRYILKWQCLLFLLAPDRLPEKVKQIVRQEMTKNRLNMDI